MSTEMRLKKLRGSGGFVMAQVTDDQQRKGNLGGPDLFLAPIGRLDVQLISKYFCNTCEKDYEGGPKIEFENPNEEVAENLILRERGQYICTTCGSTIAEYRDFTKTGEVGLAKPVTPQTQSAPSVSFEQPPVQTQSTPSISSANSTFSSITGMSVYDENAKKIGIAKQVGINSSNQIILVVSQNDGSDQTIDWSKIKKIGDIILLGDGSQAESNPFKCKCGFENKPGSKFCESCGNKL